MTVPATLSAVRSYFSTAPKHPVAMGVGVVALVGVIVLRVTKKDTVIASAIGRWLEGTGIWTQQKANNLADKRLAKSVRRHEKRVAKAERKAAKKAAKHTGPSDEQKAA